MQEPEPLKKEEQRRRVYSAACMLTVFLSAFLLFQVQPLIAKVILPWFGGTPAVWITCMLFFQVMLLLGYAYAHGIAVRLSPRAQALVHLSLLALVFSQLPIGWSESWKPTADANPTTAILGILAKSTGIPLFALAATGPLLQSWYGRAVPERSPYRLYALSNAGSFLALLSYPFLIEPTLRMASQVEVWSAGGLAFLISGAACALGFGFSWTGSNAPRPDGDQAPTLGAESSLAAVNVVLWLALAAAGSTMLLAVTNQLCQNVAAVPLLWVLPLAIYLLSFVLCFDHPRWYDRRVFFWALAVVLLGGSLLVFSVGNNVGVGPLVALYGTLLFVCCMCCHGELYRLRPGTERLTAFYLCLAAGGALGGLFVSVLAPQLFKVYLELPLGVLATCVLVLFARRRDSLIELATRTGRRRAWLAGGALLIGGPALLLLGNGAVESRMRQEGDTVLERDFYGAVRLSEKRHAISGELQRRMTHGNTVHGVQFVDPSRAQTPTAYYERASGIGLLIDTLRKREPGTGLRIGVVGLGAGTLAAYAEPGDTLRFYEISALVADLADSHFSFLSHARDRGARVEVVVGDGRIALERELARGERGNYDLLVVDAFSSDAIPFHLLTEECAALYAEHLASGGVIALHVTNRYLDLGPVAAGIAEDRGMRFRRVTTPNENDQGEFTSTWILLTDDQTILDGVELAEEPSSPVPEPEPLLWTDDYSSLVSVLR